jgi:DNA processing protein
MAGSDETRRIRAALAWLFEPTDPGLQDLVTLHGLVAAWHLLADYDLDRDDLDEDDRDIPRLRAELRGIRSDLVLETAVTEAFDTRLRDGWRVVIPEDGEWPDDLPDLAAPSGRDRPPGLLCLWARGTTPLADTLHRSVAVTGAQAPTAYGAHVASQLGHDLSAAGWTVVCSGEDGAASAAIRGALAGAGTPVVVQPCGLDRLYPAGNRMLFDQVARAGMLVSAWPPGALPDQRRYTANANLLATLTRGTVVVEASLDSPALHPLRQAITLGRPAMAIPGPVTSTMSAGCHDALRRHPRARLVTGAADVLADLAAAKRSAAGRADSRKE